MQDSDKKPRRAGRHAAPSPETEPDFVEERSLDPESEAPEPEDVPIADEYDLLGDEGDIPIRIGKKKSKKTNKKQRKKATIPAKRIAGRPSPSKSASAGRSCFPKSASTAAAACLRS